MLVDETVYQAGAARFGVDPGSLKSLGGTDGAVYACRKGSLGHVIKFIPMPEEKVAAYEEVLAFVRYLVENGVPIAAPLPSLEGRLFERVSGPETVYTVLLTPLADGRHPSARNLYDWNERLFEAWGRVMGKMHALTRCYPKWEKDAISGAAISGDASSPGTCINDWREEHDFFRDWCKEPKIAEQWERLRGPLEALPRDRSCYGLVHNDLHQWNFFYAPDARQGSGLTIIDFDVCSYHWFITDISIALYHALQEVSRIDEQKKLAFARQFMRAFLNGYSQENTLDETWLMHLPLFLRYRDILLYIVFSNTWDSSKLAPWQKQIMQRMRGRILRNEPVLPQL